MTRYYDFIQKHIDKIDVADETQRVEFFKLVRSSIEKQIRDHYTGEEEQTRELTALEQSIRRVEAELTVPATAVALPASSDVSSAEAPAAKASTLQRFAPFALVIVLALLCGWLFYTMLSPCPALTCHDSGWVRARNNESTTLIFAHNLGTVPRHISVLYSRTGNEDVAQPVPASAGNASGNNPVDIQITPTETRLLIVKDRPLHALYDLKSGWLSHETGFFRVIVRK